MTVFRMNMFCITQMQQGPKLGIPFQDDMSAPATIPAIRATPGRKLGPDKM